MLIDVIDRRLQVLSELIACAFFRQFADCLAQVEHRADDCSRRCVGRIIEQCLCGSDGCLHIRKVFFAVIILQGSCVVRCCLQGIHRCLARSALQCRSGILKLDKRRIQLSCADRAIRKQRLCRVHLLLQYLCGLFCILAQIECLDALNRFFQCSSSIIPSLIALSIDTQLIQME